MQTIFNHIVRIKYVSRRTRNISIIVFSSLIILILIGIFTVPKSNIPHEPLGEVMREAVLHEKHKVNFFGINVNPALISAYIVTGIIFVFALVVRIFIIPRFKFVPSKFQLILEEGVAAFGKIASSNSPHRNSFLGAYIFCAGVYISVGTLFELLGVQVISTEGRPIMLSAPLSDINGAIMMGCLSYIIILSGGFIENGIRGIGRTLKDFSLTVSMSFRIFGALLSGTLVNELVYYHINLSFILPIIVGVLFTILHAIIQAYVLIMLTSLFYGEVSEPSKGGLT